MSTAAARGRAPARAVAALAATAVTTAAVAACAAAPASPGPSRPRIVPAAAGGGQGGAQRSARRQPPSQAPVSPSRPASRPAGTRRPPSPAPGGSSAPGPAWSHPAGAFTPGLRLGAFTAGQSLWGFDAQVGHAALTVSYVPWGTPLRWLARVIARAVRSHAEALFDLYPGRLGRDASQIAAGTGGSDAWLRGLGRLLDRMRDPLAVSFFPEMNGPWRRSWTHGPASYIAAFRHVHAVLSRVAGSRVTFYWQPSAMHNANPDPMPWFPGRGYVQVVALDGYYYFPHDTFGAIFGATIRLVRRADPTVPIMVGETAAGPMYGRQAWEIRNLFAGIRQDRLLGLIWFNQRQHFAPYQFHKDWRLQDHPGALAAFRACLARYGPLARLVK